MCVSSGSKFALPVSMNGLDKIESLSGSCGSRALRRCEWQLLLVMGNTNALSKVPEGNAMVDELSFLGEGDFAKIYKGVIKTSRTPVAIKVPIVPEEVRRFKKYVNTHVEEGRRLLNSVKRIKGEFLVRYLAIAYDDIRKEVWIMKEYVDGHDLETLLKTPSLCPSLRSPERKLEVCVNMARGMAQLHRMNAVHGNFCLSDVLIDARDLRRPRITNFGLWDLRTFFLDNTRPEHIELVNVSQAAEIVLGDEPRPDLLSDRWTLAAVIIHWLLERPIWDMQELCIHYGYRNHLQIAALKEAMADQEPPSAIMAREWEEIEEMRDLAFLTQGLNYQATERPSAESLVQSLLAVATTPTSTKMAFNKYYGHQ